MKPLIAMKRWVTAAVLGAGPALAHAAVEVSTPADRATLLDPPTEVRITFGEAVQAPIAAVKVYDMASERVDRDDAAVVPGDGRTVRASLAPDLPDGPYVVIWRAVGLDGHTVIGKLDAWGNEWQIVHPEVLEPGKGAWGVEFEPCVVMDGDAEEHIAEVAGVLSRYCNLIGLRAFPLFKDWGIDRQDRVIKALARHASVPVINMETIAHPCQELALMLTLQEKLGRPDGRKFLLTWNWHPRPLTTAGANSALLVAGKFGMDLTLLIPDEAYVPAERFIEQQESWLKRKRARDRHTLLCTL